MRLTAKAGKLTYLVGNVLNEPPGRLGAAIGPSALAGYCPTLRLFQHLPLGLGGEEREAAHGPVEGGTHQQRRGQTSRRYAGVVRQGTSST